MEISLVVTWSQDAEDAYQLYRQGYDATITRERFAARVFADGVEIVR